jgi:hypothetical protein
VFRLGQAGGRETLYLADERGDAGVREPIVDPDPSRLEATSPAPASMRSWAEVLEIFICAVWARSSTLRSPWASRSSSSSRAGLARGLADPGELLVQGHLPRLLVRQAYQIEVDTPGPDADVIHSSQMYFIDPQGGSGSWPTHGGSHRVRVLVPARGPARVLGSGIALVARQLAARA